jgi:hypothetical protein
VSASAPLWHWDVNSENIWQSNHKWIMHFFKKYPGTHHSGVFWLHAKQPFFVWAIGVSNLWEWSVFSLKFRTFYDTISLGATITVGGWPSAEGLWPSDYIETRKGIWTKEGKAMDILGLIAVLSFGLTCFGIGYSIGKDTSNTQK